MVNIGSNLLMMSIHLALWTLIPFSDVNYFCVAVKRRRTTTWSWPIFRRTISIVDLNAASENVTMAVPPIVVPANKTHSATIIFLHGIGDTGRGWAACLKDIIPPCVKLICPNANMTNMVVDTQTRKLHSWFNSSDIMLHQDPEGADRAMNYISRMIENEVLDGILPERIIVGGFAQGGGLALFTALNHKRKIGGIVALGTDLPVDGLFPNKFVITRNRDVPMLHCTGHSRTDNITFVGELPGFDIRMMTHDLKYGLHKGVLEKVEKQLVDLKTFFEAIVPP